MTVQAPYLRINVDAAQLVRRDPNLRAVTMPGRRYCPPFASRQHKTDDRNRVTLFITVEKRPRPSSLTLRNADSRLLFAMIK